MATIVVMFNQQKLASHILDKEAHTIGRQEGCDIHIDNLGISRVHARLLRADEGYYIEDMNSSNGTFVNGQRVARQALKPGDLITIGKFTLIYEASLAETIQDAQLSPAATPAGKQLPPLPGDMLGTMQMDAETIRRRIEEMQRQKQAAEAPISAMAAKREQVAAPPSPPSSNVAVKVLLAILAVAVAALLAVVVYLLAQR